MYYSFADHASGIRYKHRVKNNYRIILFLFLAVCSLGLISLTDAFFFKFLKQMNSSLIVIADLRLTSLFLVTVAWFLTKKFVDQNQTDKKLCLRNVAAPLIWLALTAYFVLVKKVWVPELNNWIDYVAFIGTGLLAEELLFRGALFDLSSEIFGFKKFVGYSAPVWITATLFSLQHLAYHEFTVNTSSLSQVGYTFVMGIVFGSLRESSGRLWPVVLLHMATNSFTILRNLN